MKFTYRIHAVKRMLERDIYKEEVEETISTGKIIEKYEDDKPYPYYLALKFF